MMPKCFKGGCVEKEVGCTPATCPICGERFCDLLDACPSCGWCGEEETGRTESDE